MRIRITACPKMLQAWAVVTVTSPVTQVADVAVKSASMYGSLSPVAELMGRLSKTLPIRIVIRKLRRIICVLDNLFFFNLSHPLKRNYL